MSRKRTREPDRTRGLIRFEIPEAGLPAEHPARALWELTGTLDPSHLGSDMNAVALDARA